MSKKDPNLRRLVASSLQVALEGPDALKLFMTEDAVERLEVVFETLWFLERDNPLITRLFSELNRRLNLVE